MTKFRKCLKIFPMNKRNEKMQNTSFSGIGYRVSGIGYRVSGIGYRVSGIGYRVQLYHYYDKIYVNYTSVFLQLLLVYFLNLEKRGVFAYAEIPAFL